MVMERDWERSDQFIQVVPGGGGWGWWGNGRWRDWNSRQKLICSWGGVRRGRGGGWGVGGTGVLKSGISQKWHIAEGKAPGALWYRQQGDGRVVSKG